MNELTAQWINTYCTKNVVFKVLKQLFWMFEIDESTEDDDFNISSEEDDSDAKESSHKHQR